MSPIQVQVHGVNGSMRDLVAKGYLSAYDAFGLLARVKGHPNARPAVVQPKSTAFKMGGLLLLPDGMKTEGEGPYPQFDYTFGLVLAEDPGQPDYYEPGEIALKLVPRPLDGVEADDIGLRLAGVANLFTCGTPDVIWDRLAYGMTLVMVTPYSPF